MTKAHLIFPQAVLTPQAGHADLTLLLPIAGWLITLLAFFPGSIDYDYGETIVEAQRLSFSGHQSPLAAIMVFLLSHLGGFVAPVFILKVSAAYLAVGFAMLHAAGLWRRLLILALTCGPVFLVLTPSLRLSYVSLSFVSLALSLGLFGRSRVSLVLSLVALFAASLFSTGFDVGYFFTVLVIVLGRNICTGDKSSSSFWSGLPLATGLLVISKLAGFGLVAAFGAVDVDRSSTLYVSMLNDLAGIDKLGVKTCLSQALMKDGVDPATVLQNYQLGRVSSLLWGSGPKFTFPPSVEDYKILSDCWRSQLIDTPAVYLRYKIAFLKSSFFDSWFVGLYTEEWNRPWLSLPLGPSRTPGLAAGHMLVWIERNNIADFPVYLLVFLSSAALFVWRVGNRSLGFLGTSLLAAFGFMLPHIVFGQDPLARYTVNSSQFLLGLTAWMLTIQVRGNSGRLALKKD